MQERWTTLTGLVAIGLASFIGCKPAGVEDRLHRLEQRVAALEGAGAPAPAAPAPHGVTADMLGLERRLGALEQRLSAIEKEDAAGGTPAGVAETRLEQRRERRTRLREVTDQYRARLAAIRQSQADPVARQQAVREALEWYREQRQAVMAGNEPAAP